MSIINEKRYSKGEQSIIAMSGEIVMTIDWSLIPEKYKWLTVNPIVDFFDCWVQRPEYKKGIFEPADHNHLEYNYLRLKIEGFTSDSLNLTKGQIFERPQKRPFKKKRYTLAATS